MQKTRWIYMEKVSIIHNPTYMSNYDLKILPDHSSFDVDFTVVQNLTNIWSRLSFSSRLPDLPEYRKLLTYDVDVCQLLHKGLNDKFNILYIWLNNFWKYGNLPKQCPFENGDYFWKGLKLERDSLPAFLLSGEYKLNSYIYVKEHGLEKSFVTNTTVFCKIK